MNERTRRQFRHSAIPRDARPACVIASIRPVVLLDLIRDRGQFALSLIERMCDSLTAAQLLWDAAERDCFALSDRHVSQVDSNSSCNVSAYTTTNASHNSLARQWLDPAFSAPQTACMPDVFCRRRYSSARPILWIMSPHLCHPCLLLPLADEVKVLVVGLK